MRRLVVDTSLYIDWLNSGLYEEVLFQRGAVKYLSAVVLMELRAGAFRPADRRVLARLQQSFESAGRLLAPTRKVYADAGDTLRGLQARGYDVRAGHSIANDVLIALSARSIGATVVTRNERDYRAIQAVSAFRLMVASPR
jgi:predicted nucleic acid-binding protein